jgi:hypothetical protein
MEKLSQLEGFSSFFQDSLDDGTKLLDKIYGFINSLYGNFATKEEKDNLLEIFIDVRTSPSKEVSRLLIPFKNLNKNI